MAAVKETKELTGEIILWSVPGFIALIIVSSIKPIRNRSGWDFVAQIAMMALGCFVSARLIVAALELDWGTVIHVPVASYVDRAFPWRNTRAYATGIIVAPAVGLFVALTRRFWEEAGSQWVSKKVTGVPRKTRFADTWFATCDALIGELVMVSLDNDKVYIGQLTEATFDPNEPRRYIKIVPVLSGYRTDDKKRLVITTDYLAPGERVRSLARLAMLIASDHVVTMSLFDRALFHRFRKRGDIALDSADGHLPPHEPVRPSRA
jgi:hypothetical protein